MHTILNVVVSGLIVAVSNKELLPTAHRHDPKDSIVAFIFITGIATMGVSLIFFNLTG